MALKGGATLGLDERVEKEVEATGERLRFCKISFNLSMRLQMKTFLDPASPDRHSLVGKQFLLFPPILFLKLAES